MTRRRAARAGFVGVLGLTALLLLGGLPAIAAPAGAPAGGPVLAEASPDPCLATPTPAATATPLPTPTPAPGQTAAPGPTAAPTPFPVLCPAPAPGSPAFHDPIFGLLAWVFTPVFQILFLGLAGFYTLTGDIGIAIVLLTLAMRVLLVPLFRTQIVSTRRMQMVQPELKAIQQRFKGDRTRISQEQMRLYRERGVNPAAGCLPAFLQLALLLPMYQVIREGLQASNVEPMLRVFGAKVVDVVCYAPTDRLAACINPTVHWLLGLDASRPEILVNFGFSVIGIPLGISVLAIVSALLQLVQTRMVTPHTDDPQQRAQQRTFLFLPLFSLLYGTILPGGLFIYWIVTTVFSIAQQYLIVGWGSLFPLFGWTPSFAVEHTPRFPVTFAPAGSAAGSGQPTLPPRSSEPLDRAAGTVRPSKQRGRTSRRGRRR
jgi:YidC/Oxa1 family membrane protein insertase